MSKLLTTGLAFLMIVGVGAANAQTQGAPAAAQTKDSKLDDQSKDKMGKAAGSSSTTSTGQGANMAKEGASSGSSPTKK